MAIGAFSAYIIWRRIVKKRSGAGASQEEDPESYRSLNAGDEEDVSSFAREQRGNNGNSAQRSNSPPKMQEVLFETGPLDDDEEY
jgi:hypothetical protein